MTYLLALDQGTSSSRSIVFDTSGTIVAMAQRELPQIYPQPGWVEHDALRIWDDQLATAREALARAGIAAKDVAAIGITNQRETAVVWNRKTGRPIHHAIVWQDRRGEPLCNQLREQGHAQRIQQRTGLLIDSCFSATKVRWLLDNVPGARAQAERGELAFGTIDSWLLWQLTAGALHVTDVTNASRTMLFDVHRNRWDPDLLALLDIPASLMPQVLPSSADYDRSVEALLGAPVRIGGVAGDQQSALFGQACFREGMAKNTYGTGCFLLMHTGGRFQPSTNGLLTTSAAQTSPQPQYAMEGSVFVGGAVVQWLRDGLHAIKSSAEIEALAASVPDAGGVMLVPAFTGLGAPYWKPDARGTITGLTRGSTVAHVARSAPVTELRVDGGACVNNLLMQFQADLLGIPVVRPAVTETTALGAAYLAGLAAGVVSGTDELQAQWKAERRFTPTLPRDRADELMARWDHAVRQATLA